MAVTRFGEPAGAEPPQRLNGPATEYFVGGRDLTGASREYKAAASMTASHPQRKRNGSVSSAARRRSIY
jgi:hypothetical protein